jgi:hypothetical protein
VRELDGFEERERMLARAALLGAHPLRRREHACESFTQLFVGVDEHVFQHGHPSERARDLERASHATPGDRVGRKPIEPIDAEADLTVISGRETADHVEERRFPRAVRADEARDRAFADGERAAGEGFEAAEAFGDVGDGEQWSRGRFLRDLGARDGVASGMANRRVSYVQA